MSQQRATEGFFGWRMVGLAFIAYNAGLTIVLNSFGPALPVLQRELGASREGISYAFGLMWLVLGVLAPLIGNVTRWVTLRTLMITGSLLNAIGFGLLAFAHSLPLVLALFSVVIGSGTCLMAIISAPTLVSRWFERDRGKALGIAQMQPSGLIAAPLAAWLLSIGGSRLLFLSLCGLFLILVPLMSFVIDRPENVGQKTRRAAQPVDAPVFAAELIKTTREILCDPRFWLLNIAVGAFSSAGTVFAVHGTAMAMAKGIDLKLASVMLSACGAGAFFGAPVFGWMMDRIGPFKSLIVALILTSLGWLVLSLVAILPLMALMAFCLGFTMGATPPLHSACINEIFGPPSFSRVMGYSFFMKIPFLLFAVPVAGRLYDLSGGYASTYLVMVVVIGAAAFMAAILAVYHKRRIGRIEPAA